MKIPLLLILLLLVVNTPYPNTLFVMQNFDVMVPTFNLNIYQLYKRRGGVGQYYSYIYYLPDNIKVEQFSSSRNVKTFYEIISKKGDPYSVVRLYRPDGTLRVAGRRFHGFAIGIAHYYDEDGRFERDINYDFGYQFSEADLLRKMKEEYQVDLSVYFGRPRQKAPLLPAVSVSRVYINPEKKGYPEKQPQYEIRHTVKSKQYRDGGRIINRWYSVDGITGNILSIKEQVFIQEVRDLGNIARLYRLDNKGEIQKIKEYTLVQSPVTGSYRRESEKVIYENAGYENGTYKGYECKSYRQEGWLASEQEEQETDAIERNYRFFYDDDF